MRHFVEVRAIGPEDPDGRRSAEAVAAYFHLARVQASCRLLLRQLIAVSGAWTLVSLLVPGMSGATLEIGLGICGIVAAGAVVVESRAASGLSRRIEAASPNVRETRLASEP